ncbi:hypothetical protein ASF37_04440 [Aeromicrobium sp. Leaf289]|uniref:hypothetical protein n=1 Tax=Aeromicrobium sp. Leaf289 TaxID=1736324 RepID=UPI0006FE0E8A|nr:hypothetical protein [Aeromicrobium sp. Leaf289]KQP77887.1 hypothetical protein ASF37_04440 [Aeromicrobium sp. Leaf289]
MTSDRERVLVTGATGTTGRLLLRGLALHADVVPASRTADRSVPSGVRFVWGEPQTYVQALAGVSAVYLVPPTGVPDPAGLITEFVRLATDRGVRRVVLHGAQSISSSDPGLGAVQRALPSLAPEWAVLRPSWFMQNLVGDHHLARTLREESVLRTATAKGRVAFVDVEDLAAVGVAALVGGRLDREVVVTGPEALGYDEVAAVLSSETGRKVRHVSVDEDSLAASLAPAFGPAFGRLLAGMDTRIGAGEWNDPTDEVLRVAGRPPATLRDFVRRHASELGASR